MSETDLNAQPTPTPLLGPHPRLPPVPDGCMQHTHTYRHVTKDAIPSPLPPLAPLTSNPTPPPLPPPLPTPPQPHFQSYCCTGECRRQCIWHGWHRRMSSGGGMRLRPPQKSCACRTGTSTPPPCGLALTHMTLLPGRLTLCYQSPTPCML